MHAPHLPSGTVAFLFTDIEGSTIRWDRDSAAMQAAVRRHDELMRAAIGAHQGHVFKTIGDAFCAVFWTAEDAVGAAFEAQRALDAEDFTAVDGIRVRMAVHVGTSDERDGDFFGPTLNRVARLLAIGHGGQVLLSNAAAQTAAAGLPPEASLLDLGSHRLKDLAAPEQVFQILAPSLAAEFPKLRSLNVFDNNLPQQTSTFVGREQEVAEIEALLASGRFVTLFGSGGLGKSRCALQVAADRFEEYPDGVWFVELAPVGDPTLVPNEIAAIFDVQESPNRPMLETLTAYLKNKQTLLLLDNCEHVVEEASKTAAAILRMCPKVKIVATSREALKVPGEIVYQMPALGVPLRTKNLTAEAALAFSAVVLFEVRARAAQPQFVVTNENAATVAEICSRLDGIPLAIELAAARVRVLAPRQLAEKLDERFRLLTGGDRTALPRQQTMRALIDWSYDLLSEREQQFFRALSEFAGYFTIDTATAVCASETIDEFEVLDLLASLVDKSLVLAEPADHETRYRLLESIRQYGREKLIAAGEQADVAARHAAAYADLAEQLERDYDVSPHRQWFARVEAATENVRAALAWSFGPSGDVLVGQRLAATLRRVLVAFAAVEARRWIATALAAAGGSTPPLVRARLELGEATLASSLSQFRAALTASERALELFGELGDARGTAAAQRWAGRSLVYLGEVDRGEALLQQSLATLKAEGLRRLGPTLRDLAAARAIQGDMPAARSLFEQALASYKESDDEYNVAVTAGTLAEAEFRCGDAEAAIRVAEEGLAAARALGRAVRLEAWLLGNMAAFQLERERFANARDRAREALRLARTAEVEIDVVIALQHLATVAALRPPDDERPAAADRESAARLLGYVDARLAALGVVREVTEQDLYDKALSALRANLESSTLAGCIEAGGAYSEERAVTESLTL